MGELVKFSLDEVTDLLIPNRTRVDWIPVPDVVVVAWQSRTRIDDPESPVATGKQKILEVLPALGQAPAEAVLKPFVEAIGGVFDFVAAAFQVPGTWCDKDDISPEQLLKDRLQDVEDQELPILTSEHLPNTKKIIGVTSE